MTSDRLPGLETPDRLLVRLPGLAAHTVARALSIEGIPCGLECEGIRRVVRPGEEPEEPFAVTLPVAIYVPQDLLEDAGRILKSLEALDLIGEQWFAEEGGSRDELPPVPPPTPQSNPAEGPDVFPPAPDRMEGSSLRLVLFLAAAAILYWLFGR